MHGRRLSAMHAPACDAGGFRPGGRRGSGRARPQIGNGGRRQQRRCAAVSSAVCSYAGGSSTADGGTEVVAAASAGKDPTGAEAERRNARLQGKQPALAAAPPRRSPRLNENNESEPSPPKRRAVGGLGTTPRSAIAEGLQTGLQLDMSDERMGEIEASPSTRLPPAADHLLAQRPGEGIHNAPSPPHAVPPGLEPSVARERKVQLETSGEVTSGHIHSAWSMQDSRGLISNPPGMVQETAKEELIMSEIYEVLLYHGALTGQGAHPGPVLESLLVGASDLEVSRVRYTTLLKKLIAEGYATADDSWIHATHQQQVRTEVVTQGGQRQRVGRVSTYVAAGRRQRSLPASV
mmetsp:Transcript_66277/g.147932  ORF Transcript_66277/g.147932 Transcript_66277/m.147932 type:complete len:350 (+) Transcript_66277:1123-2172(+)